MNKRATPKDPVLQNYEGRCHNCYMRAQLCICELIPAINNQNYLTVIMHLRETYKTTNTGRLVCMAFENSQILVRGKLNKVISEEELYSHAKIADYQPLLLTLSDKAHVLSKELVASFNKPIHLIVPDGNWRQASRMGKREPCLKSIPWVKLPPGAPSIYQLRHEHHPEGLSTLEAIARAYSVIESPTIEEKLISFFKVMVARTLSTRRSTHQEKLVSQ